MLFSENSTLLTALLQDTHAIYDMILSVAAEKAFTFPHSGIVGYYNLLTRVIYSSHRSVLMFLSLVQRPQLQAALKTIPGTIKVGYYKK